MPEQYFSAVKKKIKREWAICWISALVFGLAAHAYKLFNLLPNWDSLVFEHHSMNMTHIGRLFLAVACAPGGFYDLPWINGLLSLLYLACGAVCICALFRLRSTAAAVLTGALVAVFPTVTSTLAYNYTADGYCLAFFCCCLAVVLIDKSPRLAVPGALLLTFAVGVYQAYVTVSVMLILLYLAERAVFSEQSVPALLKKGLRFLAAGVGGCALYWLLLKLYLSVTGAKLTDYQGVAEAFSLSGIDPLRAAAQCIYALKDAMFDLSQGLSLYVVLNIALFLLLGLLACAAVWTQKLWRKPGRLLLALALACAMPFGARLLYFIDCDVDYHNLMLMGCCVFYLAPMLFYDRLQALPRPLFCAKQWAILLVSALTVWNFMLIANVCYHKLQLSYERSYAVAVRLADRIEQFPGSAQCKKIAIFGKFADSDPYYLILPPNMTGFTDGTILRDSDPSVPDQNVILSMLHDCCSLSLQDTTAEERRTLLSAGAADGMTPWPDQGCLRVQGDTLLLCLSEVEA